MSCIVIGIIIINIYIYIVKNVKELLMRVFPRIIIPASMLVLFFLVWEII